MQDTKVHESSCTRELASGGEPTAGRAATGCGLSPPIKAGCRYYYLTSKVNCINAEWLFKSLVTLDNLIENLMVYLDFNAC